MDYSEVEIFVRVYSESQDRILRFIHTLVPNRSDAEDVLQETSVLLWRKWPQYDRDRDFVKWACGIARLEVFRMLRKKGRHTLLLNEAVLNEIADVAIHAICAQRKLDASTDALRECLETLKPQDRQLLVMRYHQDQTVQQVATACGRPLSTVHDLLVKIRMRLLRCVKHRLAT